MSQLSLRAARATPDEGVRGYMKRVRGYMKRVRGYMKRVRGYMKRVRGYMKRVRGYMKRVRGYMKRVRGYMTPVYCGYILLEFGFLIDPAAPHSAGTGRNFHP